ncbi:eukaryotic membrane protein family-domain-containing protein [Clohesyomyces aquaticus]|uniref:Eukaryotic membrane protein family-domain-containing protein n=1 Tax=Clohesyomyces aquaticus TaxID=1231657 RepID=A0A1Y1ZE17_9PLEO|nr:eukaryotic membrane protein family-domain-containing protein [Clohesyomyces aquaticus]
MEGSDDSNTYSEASGSKFEQLPTPALSPVVENGNLASARHRDDRYSNKENAPGYNERDFEFGLGLDGSASTSGSATRSAGSSRNSRRPSVNDEAILSDTSERAQRMPQIKRPGDGRRRSSVSEQDKQLKLSPRQIHELTSEPASIPIRTATPILEDGNEGDISEEHGPGKKKVPGSLGEPIELVGTAGLNGEAKTNALKNLGVKQEKEIVVVKSPSIELKHIRPGLSSRAISIPPVIRRKQSSQRAQGHAYEADGERRSGRPVPSPLNLDIKDAVSSSSMKHSAASERERDRDPLSPLPASMPIPPLSMPTFLSLELSADRPSPLYIYRPSTTDFPYESSKIKYERLVNFLYLPAKLEAILGFGALACLDAWMHVLTILPLRFLLAVGILLRWWGSVIVKEIRDVARFVYSGLGRLWRRRRRNAEAPTPVLNIPAEEEPPPRSRRHSVSMATSNAVSPNPATTARDNGSTTFGAPPIELKEKRMRSSRYRHRRTKSVPSALLPSHKADILKGLLVISSCAILMRFDASRMYHGIRGQAAIKLYVIYNVLEVCDRLFSALGQDVLECLFSRETLDRNPDGRSKVMRPFWMFILALVYNVTHAAALFYQVITLNVAVNSYSNALLTLLMSNQFVEIKGTVFKKFEKENLFQLTCSDIVERFQLWLMLLIIAMRNIVEVGGLSIRSGDSSSSAFSSWGSAFGGGGNATAPTFSAQSIVPRSFTLFPIWIGQVLNPFLLVLGSEMLVDWLKHAYITKFNQTKPEVYDKFLDVLAKDYYSNAFTNPNLTRRLGLPVLPLACLFIRSAIQTYHMFIATHMPLPFPSTATSLTTESTTTSSPATTAALQHIDQIFRRALGRSTFGAGTAATATQPWYTFWKWDLDDFIAFSTMTLVFLVAYLCFLAIKLILGMVLLSWARNRYSGMKEREGMNVETGGKRIGGWGVVDVDEEKRRWIYNDDAEGLRNLRERDEKQRKKEEREREMGTSFGHVSRYAMVAKRIW